VKNITFRLLHVSPKGNKYLYVGVNFNYGTGRLRKSLGIRVDSLDQWSTKSRRLNASHPDYFNGNKFIDMVESKLKDVYYKSLNDGVRITKAMLNAAIDPNVSIKKTGIKDFKQFWLDVIDERSRLPFSSGTITHYKQCLARFKEFEAYTGNEVHFDNLGRDMLNEFKSYLYNHRKLSHNTVTKHFKVIRTMMNIAKKRGYEVIPDYEDKDFKLINSDADTIYLSLDDLSRLNTFKFNDSLRNAVDLFLVGSFTGCRYQDYSSLSMDNIRNVSGIEMIYMQQKKTLKPVVIPVHPVLKEVLKRHNGFPYNISSQKLNEYIKDACRLAGFTDKQVRYYNQGGKMKSETLEKWQRVSSHTARRSFATNMFLAGIERTLIMKITGHTKESTFMKYLRIDSEQAGLLLAGSSFFK
jgi:integrase